MDNKIWFHLLPWISIQQSILPALLCFLIAYAPCDGRSIAGSTLARDLGVPTAPDLRGRFLRGLNLIYNVGEPVGGDSNFFEISNADSDDTTRTRSVGSFQSDEFKSHAHEIVNQNTATRGQERCASGRGENVVCGDENTNAYLAILPSGGSETRPKNVAVYYYIKIND